MALASAELAGSFAARAVRFGQRIAAGVGADRVAEAGMAAGAVLASERAAG